MNKLFLILFLTFTLAIQAYDKTDAKDNQLSSEKISQDKDNEYKGKDLNFTSEELIKFLKNSSCEENLKELDKKVEPKSYTDCRDIKNSYCSNNSCFLSAGTCRWCRIVIPGGPTGELGCYNP